jgi:demethylmenaquinone methyltransferase/2-methoxy-6-polyprenyl-1,4-benzoquinol methylase
MDQKIFHMDSLDELLRQQIAYYRARAPEYDEWFLRRGRYDRGPEANAQWFEEAAMVRAALDRFQPAGDVLELACGTGLWTKQLLTTARQITAMDAAPEMLEINRQRLHSAKVRYVQADLFTWRPEERFDTVFFGFWLSHVPPQHFETFWRTVADALKPGGRVFFVDSKYDPTSIARDHKPGDSEEGEAVRRLNDGREFRVVKIFYARDELQERLIRLGWNTSVSETPHYFIYGEGTFANQP